ncbi:MAG TPA: HEAT repeat domain-containing protein [Pyrinomonadaceae bacterium]
MEQKRILRVVVASPGDVRAERDLLPGVLEELNRSVAAERGLLLELRRWETDAYPGFHLEGPQGLIDPILKVEECDILIGIFWKRFGTPTAEARSGTEHEIMRACAAWEERGRPQVMVYFNQKAYAPRSKEETDQWGQVLDFKGRFPEKGLWWSYKSRPLFEKLVRNHLGNFIRQHYPLNSVSADASAAEAVPQGRGADELTADYRAWLAGRVGRVYVFGEAEARPLDRVFVELSIVEEAGRPSSHAEFLGLMDAEMRRRRDPFMREDAEGAAPGGGSKPARTVGPDELLRGRTQAVITGAPGCGKTTLLKYLALKTLEAGERLPVFLECKAITAESFRESGGDLAELLFDRGMAAMPGVGAAERERLRELFTARLAAGEAAVFLDGLDEVSGAEFFPRLRESVGEFLRSAHANNTLVISTRPYALQARFEGLKQMEIAPLNPRQVEEFFAHYYGDEATTERLLQALRQRRPLRELMRVPFLLAVIARLYREHDRIVESRLELYRQIVLQLAVQLDREKSVVRTEFRVPDRGGALKLDFLRHLAFERLLLDEVEAEGERLVFTGEDILAKAKQFWAGGPPPAWSPYDIAEDVKATPLLREVGADAYAFSHLTVQEYLAATVLARRPDCEKLFCRAYFNPTLAEMEVLPMTLGLVPRPERLCDALEHLPESLTYASLRLRARALAYATDLDRRALSTLVRHLDRFLKEERREESPYWTPVVRSFAAAGGRALDFLLGHATSVLRGGGETARKNAAEALGEFGDERGVAPLLEVLKVAADYDARGAAFSALGSIGDRRALPFLLDAAVSENESARWQVIMTLGKFKDERVTPTLISMLTDKKVSMPTLWSLQVHGDTEVAIPHIVSTLRGEDDEARDAVLDAVQFITVSERLIEPLTELLQHPQWVIRHTAAWALGSQGNERAVEPLAKVLKDDDKYNQSVAIRGLREIGGERAITALTKFIETATAELHDEAVATLAELGYERAIDLLPDVIQDPKRVSQEAVLAFATTKDRRALARLLELLDHAEPTIRRSSAEALGHLGDPSAIPQLIVASRDNELRVRAAAVAALGKIGGDKVVEPLLSAINDHDSSVRRSAAEALGKVEDEVLLEGLVRALGNGNEFVRRRAAEVVGYYVEPGRARWELERLAEDDPAAEIREAAKVALAAVERRAACFG